MMENALLVQSGLEAAARLGEAVEGLDQEISGGPERVMPIVDALAGVGLHHVLVSDEQGMVVAFNQDDFMYAVNRGEIRIKVAPRLESVTHGTVRKGGSEHGENR